MQPTKKSKLASTQTCYNRKTGFALIAALGIMGFLVLLAVSMFTLASINIAISNQSLARTKAQANAKMAMMIAIGELQKEMGPDKRISARAAILDNTPNNLAVDGVANPHYLGVWDSWDTWLTDRKDSLTIQNTYTQGRQPLFRKWLVSHADTEAFDAEALNTATNSTLADFVTMWTKQADSVAPEDHVVAGRVPVWEGNQRTGNYAWWITDESQKARLDLKARDDTTTFEDAQNTATQTGRMGIETMTGMASFDTSPEFLAKMVTTGQAEISVPAASERFNDITAYSLGLLTDVRSGGFKSDLNLAFESNEVPEEMRETQVFGEPFEAPIRPMTGELASITPQNPYIAPMGWRRMREHYRLYREFSGGDILKPIQWSGNTPYTNRFLMGYKDSTAKWDVAGYSRLPVLLRQTWVLATMSEKNPTPTDPDKTDYYITTVPIVWFWNPYNIPLELESTEISTLGGLRYSVDLYYKFYLDDELQSEGEFSRIVGFGGDAGQPGYRMVPVENGLNTIRFEPGEVRMFSTDEEFNVDQKLYASSAHHFPATPGYTPIQDGPGARGLRYRLRDNRNQKLIPDGDTRTPTIALRLAKNEAGQNYKGGGSRDSVVTYTMQETEGAKGGVYDEEGNDMGETEGYHDVNRLGFLVLDWFEGNEVEDAWIVSDHPAERAGWLAPGTTPQPIGIVSIVAKSSEELDYSASGGFAADFRNRGWLHAPPTNLGGAFLANPNDLNRANSPYQLHFTPVFGDQGVSQYLQADGPNGYYGSGYSASGQTHVIALDLPTTPIRSLGAFAGVQVSPARHTASPSPNDQSVNLKLQSVSGAAFGPGIGNAYAHPMIDPEEVYTRNNFGNDPGWEGNTSGAGTVNFALNDDYWDHLFLANEALWDSWFCSGIAPVVRDGTIVTPKTAVATDFFSDEPTPLSPHFQHVLRGKTVAELASLVETTTAATGENGWDLIGSYILNRGQFNVNSTSKEAWKAVLMSLRDRPIATLEPDSGTSVLSGEEDEASLSRHSLANGQVNGNDPEEEYAWRGIRKLDEPQIDKLAEEIVRQVKLRGPFLNMADFINRRLSSDKMGVTGALQAAIDWDEFNAGYNGTTSGTGESINENFKGSGDMITSGSLPASYPNEEAAMGSRYAGIPGYVMQSDILQGISTSLSVRGDTFVIRAYGESVAADGKTVNSAWCEAVVQRMPEYVNPADEPGKKMRFANKLPNDTPALHPDNEKFGRGFEITSFRWLDEDEI